MCDECITGSIFSKYPDKIGIWDIVLLCHHYPQVVKNILRPPTHCDPIAPCEA